LEGLAVFGVTKPAAELEPVGGLYRDLTERRQRAGFKVRELQVARSDAAREQRADHRRRRREREGHRRPLVSILVEVVRADDAAEDPAVVLQLQLLAELLRLSTDVGRDDHERRVVGIADAARFRRAVGGDTLEGK